MNKFLLSFLIASACSLGIYPACAQKPAKTQPSGKGDMAAVSGYADPGPVTEVKDLLENNEAYPSIKDLLERHHVTLVFNDHTFRGNAKLRRGDFVVSFNSALNSISDAVRADSLDTVLVNTYDRNRAYITSVTQVKDLKPGSIYYIAVQDLLEKWGINAPFTKAAVLNAQSYFYEDE